MTTMQVVFLSDSVNISNMKFRTFFTALILVIITSCKADPQQSFYDLIHDNFLSITDTIAYSTGKLIQVPNDTSKIYPLDKICILIDTVYINSTELSKSILKSVQSEDLKDYEKLMLDGMASCLNSIDVSKIKNTGRFSLITPNFTKGLSCEAVAGKIFFHETFVTHDRAIVAFSISNSPKAGYTNCWLFKKHNETWEIVKRIELERW
jgi:hypothetical protein